MAVATMLTRNLYLEYLMRNDTLPGVGSKLRTVLRILECLSVVVSVLGCVDSGSALIDLRLEIQIISSKGAPVAATKVHFRDHGLPESQKDASPQGPICITNLEGRCSARVRYRYSVEGRRGLRFLQKDSRDSKEVPLSERFELLIPANGTLQRLSVLPSPDALELHGFNAIEVTAIAGTKNESGSTASEAAE